MDISDTVAGFDATDNLWSADFYWESTLPNLLEPGQCAMVVLTINTDVIQGAQNQEIISIHSNDPIESEVQGTVTLNTNAGASESPGMPFSPTPTSSGFIYGVKDVNLRWIATDPENDALVFDVCLAESTMTARWQAAG